MMIRRSAREARTTISIDQETRAAIDWLHKYSSGNVSAICRKAILSWVEEERARRRIPHPMATAIEELQE